MNNVNNILQNMYFLLEDRKNWSKGSNFRNRFGEATHRADEDICSMCLYGALIKSTGRGEEYDQINARDWLQDIIALDISDRGCGIIEFNDRPTTTHEDVLRIVKKAIEVTK